MTETTQFEATFTGEATAAMERFYTALPSVPRAAWPAMMHGMGYNFEYYDALFALVLATVQLSLGEGDYTPRHMAMQAALLPFCSEFGIELGQPMQRSHRALYAELYQRANGEALPERYPRTDDNPWFAASRRWTAKMRARLEGGGDSVERARYALGYLWAIEHLSVQEFDRMREAWGKMGVSAPYLEAHCAVEEEHDAYATRAMLAFCKPDDPLLLAAMRAHEEDLGGYYRELCGLLEQTSGADRA
ncbi:MAG: iron-containing redox enzyme family protein [Byssovorax sp.]